MILIRTREVDARLEAFACQLQAFSGFEIAYVLDARHGDTSVTAHQKVLLSQPACEALGLYCPRDFAWRCGDYGMYLARAQFPHVDFFWQIESDVRIGGGDPAEFFAAVAASDHDLLATYTEIASPEWAWAHTVEGKGLVPWKCFFPVVRLSAAAIDLLSARRRSHSAQWSRRHCWTNDEGFVATTLVAASRSYADLNDFGVAVYSSADFSFETVRDGDLALPGSGPPMLFHPVLFGTALRDKLARLSKRQTRPSLAARVLAKVDKRVGLTALARRRNRRTAW
jgi:hypothetical protein